ncbi:DUF826 domain-containing protein [Salmonella enterica]|nr:DUF826 domain-containing protein [Salmonella enterica]EKT1705068.1 DUF826 domain-containing protein [Salmonella enterica]ELC6907416.1 DUF826 domain-containing protein [Salmonella enterica]
MPDMKDIVTDDRVKNALRSDTVTTLTRYRVPPTVLFRL